MEDIFEWCYEWSQDERNIQYWDIVGSMETLPVSMYLNDNAPIQDQKKEGWKYGCVYYSNSQGGNIMNFLENSEVRSKGSEMCEYAVKNNLLDPKAGTYIINWPKVGTTLWFLDGYAQITTIEQAKHSIANKRPVQCGSNKIDWNAATLENEWTVMAGNWYGHSIIPDWYDDLREKFRIRQSYDKWNHWHQWIRYSEFGLLFPTKFWLIDKSDPIITNHKKTIMNAITIDAAKEWYTLGLWDGTRPNEPITRQEAIAVVMRAMDQMK